jgi:hypothetical protein
MSLKDDKQQNIQIELDFSSALTGAARAAAGEETESLVATNGSESPARTREVTLRAKGVSLETTIAELASYLRGWRSYFGFCETPYVLIQLTRAGSGSDCEPLCGGNGKHHAVAEQLS